MKTIIEMARKSGLIVDANQSGFDSVEAFAALVRADEREACLNWCAAYATDDGTAQKIDAAIRARGQA
jgi:hypothetical protein